MKHQVKRTVSYTHLDVYKRQHKEITHVKEQQETKLEENKKFALEEMNKVRTHVTERCDGVEAAMTNITGQVRQSQEEIELIRNRPTGYHHFPMSENREWLNFRQYKRKPMEFLAHIEEYLEKHRGNRWVQNLSLIHISPNNLLDRLHQCGDI